MNKLLSLVVVSMIAAPALAQSTSGNTTGQPTWNRPVANGNSAPNGLSGTGTATPYEVVPFTVTLSGVYNWQNTSGGWDNYSFIYQNSFNAGSPLTNVMIGNDDNPSIGLSGFSGLALNAGTQYYYVVTGFANTDFGAWTVDVTLPAGTAGGQVVFTPTPGAAALLGLGGLVAGRRRR